MFSTPVKLSIKLLIFSINSSISALIPVPSILLKKALKLFFICSVSAPEINAFKNSRAPFTLSLSKVPSFSAIASVSSPLNISANAVPRAVVSRVATNPIAMSSPVLIFSPIILPKASASNSATKLLRSFDKPAPMLKPSRVEKNLSNAVTTLLSPFAAVSPIKPQGALLAISLTFSANQTALSLSHGPILVSNQLFRFDNILLRPPNTEPSSCSTSVLAPPLSISIPPPEEEPLPPPVPDVLELSTFNSSNPAIVLSKALAAWVAPSKPVSISPTPSTVFETLEPSISNLIPIILKTVCAVEMRVERMLFKV